MRKRRKYIDHEFLQSIGDNMRELRVDRDLSQEQLAKRCGVHRTYITEIENGQRNISALTMLSMAEGLEVQPCVLLHCEKDHERSESIE